MTKQQKETRKAAIKKAENYVELYTALKSGNGISWNENEIPDIQDALVKNRTYAKMAKEIGNIMEASVQDAILVLINRTLSTQDVKEFYKHYYKVVELREQLTDYEVGMKESQKEYDRLDKENNELKMKLYSDNQALENSRKDVDFYSAEMDEANKRHDAAKIGAAMLLEEFTQATGSLPKKETIRALAAGGIDGNAMVAIFLK